LAVRKLPDAARQQRPAVAYHPERDAYYLLNVDDARQLAGPIVSNVPARGVPVHPAQQAGILPNTGGTVRYGTSGILPAATPNTGSTPLPIDDEAIMIRNLLQSHSKNKVADFLGGSKSTAYKRINRATGEE
jgi:hypothetical protein